jgi:hypothetical protein
MARRPRRGGGEIEDRSGRGADFGSSGPMERGGQSFGGKGGSKFKDEIDDEIPF